MKEGFRSLEFGCSTNRRGHRCFRRGFVGALILGLAGCSLISEFFGGSPAHEPTPLADFPAEARLNVRATMRVGPAGDYVFTPALIDERWYATAKSGVIHTFDKPRLLTTGTPLTAGIGAAKDVLAVVDSAHRLRVYRPNGDLRWEIQLPNAVLAPPLIASDRVIVRGVDGKLTGFAVEDGKQQWQFSYRVPSLSLRNYASGVYALGNVYFGLPGGRLVSLDPETGAVRWEAQVAQARGSNELESIVDIASLPAVVGTTICAVAYRGAIGCFDAHSGSPQWIRPIGSDRGPAIDLKQVYLTDTDGILYAFDRTTGATVWKQDKLAYRGVTGPAFLNNYLVVADGYGVVHVLDSAEGRFIARAKLDGSSVLASLQSVDDTVIVQTQAGHVYQLALGAQVR